MSTVLSFRGRKGAACPQSNKQAVCKDLKDVGLAGAMLTRMYGEQALATQRVPVEESEVQAFDQREVFSEFSTEPYKPYNAWQNASMARDGYVFIPKACKEGRLCKLHVAFHGCLQGGATDKRTGHSGNLLSKYAGYNERAATNDIIVLYPQVQARSSDPINPQGCWDWWGQDYTDEAYPHETRTADQGRSADDQYSCWRAATARCAARATLSWSPLQTGVLLASFRAPFPGRFLGPSMSRRGVLLALLYEAVLRGTGKLLLGSLSFAGRCCCRSSSVLLAFRHEAILCRSGELLLCRLRFTSRIGCLRDTTEKEIRERYGEQFVHGRSFERDPSYGY